MWRRGETIPLRTGKGAHIGHGSGFTRDPLRQKCSDSVRQRSVLVVMSFHARPLGTERRKEFGDECDTFVLDEGEDVREEEMEFENAEQ